MALTKLERFKNAIAGKPVDHPPVWMMRQAGRYLPQYQEVRGKYEFLELCRTPEAAAEVSLQPLDILDVDAIIVFNDIVTPMEAMGGQIVFTDRGPSLVQPIQSRERLDHFRAADFDATEPVCQTLSLIRQRAGADVPVFGFAGAPFTMACYAIEGAMTRNLDVIKSMRYNDPALLHDVLERFAETVANYLRIQVEAGANMVQLFDTWAGSLSLPDYREFALAYQKRVIEKTRSLGVPVALYLIGTAAVLPEMVESGADVLSVDWRLPLSEVRRRVGDSVVLQGNLDPLALYGPPEGVRHLVHAMLEDAAGDAKYIANLGHGILPRTSVAAARAFIETVKGVNI